ncbi:uncharacterized protein EDB91DRAFT_1246316 [Suillus paluster]|uniref:uncharacterized protein n=1 Tax=Suillus paluster TaxID=48578 RepID=UPI001B872D12|nr:uncharacterized protein EDB91DRAFT_1246316 [Suillus paluster]KAG1745441.1 hypothetical protein EDB91DRAFT_1246316 [Suillus paluster]
MTVAVDDIIVDQKQLSQPSNPQTTVPGSQAPSAPDLDAPKSQTNGHTTETPAIPQVNVNGEPVRSPRPSANLTRVDAEDARWGSNFWVTLIDPQTSTVFFACPATGQVSWDPPAGTFVLPPSTEGEWWELSDESRGGIPYYYQTKTGETVWERPETFVIPLTIIQQTALGRRLSMRKANPEGQESPTASARAACRARTRSQVSIKEERHVCLRSKEEPALPRHSLSSTRSSPGRISASGASPAKKPPTVRRSFTTDQYGHSNSPRGWPNGHHLPPIPASPFTTEPSTPNSRKSSSTPPANVATNGSTRSNSRHKEKERRATSDIEDNSPSRSRAKSSSYVPHRSPIPQSLNAAVEMLSMSDRRAASDIGHGPPPSSPPVMDKPRPSTTVHPKEKVTEKREALQSPLKLGPGSSFWTARSPSTPPTVLGKTISSPVPNKEATKNMSAVKNPATGKPIPITRQATRRHTPTATLASGTYPVLPHDLASDIQQFVESDYARQYFSTHRTGFIFRRKVPVAQMMTWQKAPLSSPLLTLNRSLKNDAVRIFKVIQHIMGDREREKSAGIPVHNGSAHSLTGGSVGLLEEERWLLGEGLGSWGAKRRDILPVDEAAQRESQSCFRESVFKGWQMLCVLLTAFPPSKNFETYLRSFMQQRTSQQEGRVDVIAKHCLRRLVAISKKGPRGKPPTMAENRDRIGCRLQPFHIRGIAGRDDAPARSATTHTRRYPSFSRSLQTAFLALGGTKAEGIFRVPGDSDSVSELKLRIDRGYYTLDSVDDPHRELCDPLVPEEMYNDCITHSREPETCIQLVRRLPTINRRVVIFLISFLQFFLEEKVQAVTKMTSANLALVMAPNLLRCNSESMTVVFTNAQYEQVFVYNLLMHLKCDQIDAEYVPVHGLGASLPSPPQPRVSKSRNRKP